MTTSIHLGFEVGSGAAIAVPLAHMVVTGQTQLSGKTTTLEALVDRSKLRAIAFVTKRFESAFAGGRRIQPYFRERTDWQFVASLLEATLSERMRKERPFIFRVTKNTKTLADVHRNVRAELKKTKSNYARDMYMMLDEYLRIAVEDLGHVKFATAVDLGPGLNVMDLGELQLQTQSLVIASVMEWIYRHERDTVTIVPEAWEFLPLQRSSPVLVAAEQLIRKGAAGGNFVWLDSQDLAGVAAAVRKQIAVYLVGVQREENEVKRVLAHISGATKPARDGIMSLDVGHMYACWRGHAHHVYVQPKWMNDEAARNVALGILPMSAAPKAPRAKPAKPENDEMNQQQLSETVAAAVASALKGIFPNGTPMQHQPGPPSQSPPAPPPRKTAPAAPAATTPAAMPHVDELADAVFDRVVARLQAEHPTLMKVNAEASEIEVHVKRQTIEVDGDTLRGRLARLLHEGFFDEPKGPAEAIAELKRRGAGEDVKFNTSRELAALTSMGFLVREGKTSDTKYQAVEGMKVNVIEE